MEVEAQAKLNLTFEVLGRRGDGYHEVKTVMQTVGLSRPDFAGTLAHPARRLRQP